MNERKYTQGLRVLLRNEKWELRKCERQTKTEQNKLKCEDDRLQETRENTRKREVTIKLKRKTKAV
jgi:hypothetical protein